MLNRTSLATIGSIVGVIAAGSAAVSANIGILSSADAQDVGTMSAGAVVADAPATTTTAPLGFEFVDVYVDGAPQAAAPAAAATTGGAAAASASTPSSTYEAFAVDIAGTVTIENYGTRIEVEEVAPAAGWTYSTSEKSATELTVTFEGSSTFVFTAVLLDDGTISASVDQPVTRTISQPPATAPTAPSYYEDDDDDDDRDEGRDENHDDDREDDHEGGDDDD